MKRLPQILFILLLACFSFFYTDKVATILKSKDPLLEKIKEKNKSYVVNPIDAFIEGSTVIPGLNGFDIDIDKSYDNMKKIGVFNDNLIVLKEVSPNDTINNYYDKYIVSGNKLKSTIGFIFIVEEDSNIDKILEILEEKEINATFFIDGAWIEANKDSLKKISDNNHEVGNLGYKNKYEESLFIWTNNNLKRNNKNIIKYCYLENINDEVLNLCKNYRYKTVIPSLIIKKEPLKEVKKNLDNGIIISFNINKKLESELKALISYINKKGYKIDLLSKHLNEKRSD